jgi:hypothetical protein
LFLVCLSPILSDPEGYPDQKQADRGLRQGQHLTMGSRSQNQKADEPQAGEMFALARIGLALRFALVVHLATLHMSTSRNDEIDALALAKTVVAAIEELLYYPVGGRDACMRGTASNLESQRITADLQALIPTASHGDESVGQVRLVWICARSPLEYESYRLVYQKVKDGEIDVELVFVLVFHAPSKVEQAVKWFAIGVMPVHGRRSQLLLQVAHGWIVNMVSSQHEGWGDVSAVGLRYDSGEEGASQPMNDLRGLRYNKRLIAAAPHNSPTLRSQFRFCS